MSNPPKIQSDGPAPYTAPKAVIDFMEAYRQKGLQTPFTPEVLIKAGVSETLAPRTLVSLKLLSLVSEDGQPTVQLVDLRKAPEPEYKARVAALVRDVYGEVFSYVDPTTDPPDRVRDAFRSYTPVGQQGRMVTLFLGLCEYAGIISPTQERKAGSAGGAATRRANRGATRRDKAKRPATAVMAPSPEPASGLFDLRPAPAAPGGHPLVQGLLRELPPVGAQWPVKKMEKWLELQRAVFNVLYQIVDSDSSTDRGDKAGGSG